MVRLSIPIRTYSTDTLQSRPGFEYEFLNAFQYVTAGKRTRSTTEALSRIAKIFAAGCHRPIRLTISLNKNRINIPNRLTVPMIKCSAIFNFFLLKMK